MGDDVMEWPGYDSCSCAADRRALEPLADDPSVYVCSHCGYRTDTPGEGVLGDAFDVINRQWGLRGDTHLWRALRDRLATTPTPPTRDEVRAAFVDAIRQVADIDIDHEQEPHVRREHLDHGGMSGGMVDIGWWRTKGLPLLVERATARRPPPDVPAAGAAAKPSSIGSRIALGFVMLILYALPVGLVGGGAFLLYQAAWGTRVEATVLGCDGSGGVFSGAATYRSDCIAEWEIDGRVVVGDLVGGGEGDTGKTMTVTVRGDTAYQRSLVLPIILLALGTPFLVLVCLPILRRLRR